MRKAIVKVKLNNHEDFEDKLSEIDLDFGAIYWLHDRVYIPRSYKSHQNLPRLIMRTTLKAVDEKPQYALILKRHIEDSGIDIVEETPVTDYENTVNIILQLGFKPQKEVSRRRQDLSMGEGTMIFLDQIDGTDEVYAKIESVLSPDDSVITAISDLKKTFATLNETNIVELPYSEL